MSIPPSPPLPPGAESLATELRQLQAYAAELGAIVNKARDAAPAQATGVDETRMATAVIDQDASPVSLTLDRAWADHLRPEEIGPALLAAYQAAMQTHLATWGDDLRRGEWQYDARDLDARVAARVAAAPDTSDAVAAGFAVKQEPDRTVQQLLEETLREMDRSHEAATSPPPPPPPPGPETTTLRVSLDRGQLQSVEVNASWAERRSAGEINALLAQAVQTARLATPSPTARDPHRDHLDDLLGDVFALLTPPRERR